MDPHMSFGPASPLVGGSSALNEAIARRQTGQGGITQQVTPSGNTFNPQIQQPPVTGPAPGMPQGAPAPSPSAPPSSQPAASPFPFDPAEAKMIAGSLANRLKAISKLQGA